MCKRAFKYIYNIIYIALVEEGYLIVGGGVDSEMLLPRNRKCTETGIPSSTVTNGKIAASDKELLLCGGKIVSFPCYYPFRNGAVTFYIHCIKDYHLYYTNSRYALAFQEV